MSARTGVTRLYPQPGVQLPLQGLYLGLELRERARPGRTLVYSNFVASADGRVSVAPSAGAPVSGVPAALANPRDWRLYQELAAQADVMVASGHYVREFADGHAGPAVTWDTDPALDDIARWRLQRQLPTLPHVAIVSRKLDFDPAVARSLGAEVTVITGTSPNEAAAARLKEFGIALVAAGDDSGVDGQALTNALTELGYTTAYLAGGPRLLHTFLRSHNLDLLFVTVATALLGGERFASMVEGPLLEPPTPLRLEHLYLDPQGPSGGAQLFAGYRAEPGTP